MSWVSIMATFPISCRASIMAIMSHSILTLQRGRFLTGKLLSRQRSMNCSKRILMKTKIDLPAFTPTKWDTAEQKKRFVLAFIRLVNGDFKQTLFPHWFYNRLSNCFGNIAHYNQYGFYDEQFSTLDRRCRFVSNCLNYSFHGDPTYTYSDAERFLQTWLIDNKILDKLRDRRDNETKTNELSTLKGLAEKHGYQLTERV